MTRYLLLPIVMLLFALPATAGPFALVDARHVDVCPASGEATPPDFTGAACRQRAFGEIDPQGTHLWVRMQVDVDERLLDAEGPLGLYVSAKASSRVWLNGEWLGANGTPAAKRAAEVPGKMDALIYVPRTALHEGRNELVMELSSLHGFLHLTQPLHFIAVGPYFDGPDFVVFVPWGSFVTLGVFLCGALFFLVMALRGEGREGSALLAAASSFAAAQLFTETSRTLIGYLYPWQDVRLVLILALACLFGLSLAAYLLLRLTSLPRSRRYTCLSGITVIMAAAVALSRGFDDMTAAALTVPLFIGAVLAIWRVSRGQRDAISYALVLLVMLGLVVFDPSAFLNAYLYYCIAALLLFLFYRQATALADERRERRQLARRAEHLEFVLAQAEQKAAPMRLEVSLAGETRYVATDRIVQFKGADDYVEIHFEDGTTTLFNGTLAALEETLPEAFLRIHRSHIANTAFVGALTRDANGAGELRFTNGTVAPVSRRILPKVKSVLGST